MTTSQIPDLQTNANLISAGQFLRAVRLSIIHGLMQQQPAMDMFIPRDITITVHGEESSWSVHIAAESETHGPQKEKAHSPRLQARE